MQISIETLNNGTFEKLGLWKELVVPSEEQKRQAIEMTKVVNAVTNPKGVTFVLAEIQAEETLIAIKDGALRRRFEGEAIEKFKTQMNHPSFSEEKIELI